MTYRTPGDPGPLVTPREQIAADLMDVAQRLESIIARLGALGSWKCVATLAGASVAVRGVMVAIKQ